MARIQTSAPQQFRRWPTIIFGRRDEKMLGADKIMVEPSRFFCRRRQLTRASLTDFFFWDVRMGCQGSYSSFSKQTDDYRLISVASIPHPQGGLKIFGILFVSFMIFLSLNLTVLSIIILGEWSPMYNTLRYAGCRQD
jgi:hypothetical protein